MALIKCYQCGQMISDKAKACPKCGTLVEINNEACNELRSDTHVYSQYGGSINPIQKKKTSPALITSIALLSIAVLALGGFVLYKMVYEPSLLDQSSQEEVLIDMSGEDASGNNVVAEEQIEVVSEQSPAIIEEPVDAAADENTSSDNVWLAQRYATTEDIAGLSSDEIRIMRNSIFARHGRYFKDPVLQEYFNSQPWYNPYRKEVPTQELNDYERKNVEFLKMHE